MSAKEELEMWSWPSRPTNEVEFDQMMSSLDEHLAAKKLQPFQRGLHASRHVSWALDLSGAPILSRPEERGPAFSPRDLLARIHDWYDANYGDQMKIDWSPGSIVVVISNNLWKVRIPKVWGTMKPFVDRNLSNVGISIGVRSPSTHNVLRSVDGLTQAFASKMTDAELQFLLEAFIHGSRAMAGLNSLRGSLLFDEARVDYRHSVDAISTGREFGKARWETAQTGEKVLKGLLARAGHAFPTTAGKGHDHLHLGVLVRERLGLNFDANTLAAIKCSAAVRYGEIESALEDALSAHAALLHFLAVVDYHARVGPKG